MVSKPLDMKYIYTRNRGLAVNQDSLLSEGYIDTDLSDVNPSSYLYDQKVSKIFESQIHYKDALKLLENLYINDKFSLLEECVQKTINNIIPSVPPMEIRSCISSIYESPIGDVNRDRLIEATKTYKNVDRIKKNHKNLSKRFKVIDNIVDKTKTLKDKCFKLSESIDTYGHTPFIKINIALEEMAYLSYINEMNLDPSEVTKYITEYFLLRLENSKEDIDSYKRAIIESKVLPNGADASIKFLTESNTIDEYNFVSYNPQYWVNRLNEWKLNPNKDVSTIVELAKDNIANNEALSAIIETIVDFSNINDIDVNINPIFNNIENMSYIESANAKSILEKNNIENVESLIESLELIYEEDINDSVYSNCKDLKEPLTFSASDIDSFRMHNLITDAQDVGEVLDNLENSSMKESPLKIKKIKSFNDIDINESNLAQYIDNGDHISIQLRRYCYEGSIENINQYLESVSSCMNNILYNKDTYFYYNISENSFDTYIRSRYSVITENRQFNAFNKSDILELNNYLSIAESLSNSPYEAIVEKLNDRFYAAEISLDEFTLLCDVLAPYDVMGNFLELCDIEANPQYNSMKNYYKYSRPIEEFNIYDDNTTRLEMASYIMGLTEDQSIVDKLKANLANAVSNVNPIKKKKDNNANNNGEKIAKDNDANSNSDSIVDKLKANLADATSDDDKDNKPSKKKNNSSDDDNDKDYKLEKIDDDKKKDKNDKLSLNDAKLAFTGAKSKLKYANAKQEDISKDIDIEFNHLLNDIKQACTVDHREEIITGRVTVSLSRIVKLGIRMLAVGAVGGKALGINALVLPAIGAVAHLARSKFTTRKEKIIILDEIDTELKVLDREISRAEASGSTPKYRELLTIQKNLQRKRQEIYYNLARTNSRLPISSTNGLRTRE